MAGRGPAPKDPSSRRRKNAPARGDWQPSTTIGWQHGDTPDPPPGLSPAAIDAWRTWMGSGFAAHWDPGDLPGLRVLIRLYDEVMAGRGTLAGELRLWADNSGVTPRGQQDRRWQPPADDQAPAAPAGGDRYSHLRILEGPDPYTHLRDREEPDR